MAAESAADRLAFFSADDFGIEAVYTPSGGAASDPIPGQFDDSYLSVNLGEHVATSDSRPTFCCRSADIPSGAVGGDAGDTLALIHPVTGQATTYRVADLQPDGTGMTLVTLAR